MSVQLAVVILNYDTYELTADCLASLAGEVRDGMRVLVVDNASPDGSAGRLEQLIQERRWAWAEVVRSPVNGGFAAGNNVGIRAVPAAAYLLLNSDTLVRPGAITSLLEAAASHPDAGIIGAGIITARGEPDGSFFRLPGPVSELLRGANTGVLTRALERFSPLLPPTEEPCQPGWVGFAAVLLRAEVIARVGLLDEGYFMYFEDVDYCRRARAAGWKVLYWPRAKIVHLLGASSAVTGAKDARRRAPRYFYEARARYFAKFYGRSGLWAANALWHAGNLLSRARSLLGRAPAHRDSEARDIWTNAGSPLRARAGGGR